MKRIYIIENNEQVASFLVKTLKESGYQPFLANDYDKILAEFTAYEPHLVLIAVGTPAFDGLFWSREIRALGKCPILLMPDSSYKMSQVIALENGADGYLSKPLNAIPLQAVIERTLKRVYASDKGSELKLRPMEIDYQGVKQSLTRKEYFLMKAFIERPSQLLTRQYLLQLLTNNIGELDDNTLSVNMTRLRRKLSQIGLENAIQTVRGKGYKFNPK
ncbi:response regulator transcription factor [Thalassobacillus devorans]|uniref:response regulator transcription factor n=1 Tax=Thalassobacillus devorans TaxID=279813 RepID=UPI000A1C9054|nr:response regulator transcription factor [Thalassobacillus devorans]